MHPTTTTTTTTTTTPTTSNHVLENYLMFIEKLQKKEPFAFAHFNDGEMRYIFNYSHDAISRGAQEYDAHLADDLQQAFLNPNPLFYRGIPCATCFPQMNLDTIHLLFESENKNNNTVPACVFHHTYWNTNYRNLFFDALKTYDRITWITNPRFNVDLVLEHREKRQIILPETNAYTVYAHHTRNLTFQQGELVLLLCGPVGRILASKWIDLYPETTFLCLGSYFDHLAFGTPHAYYFENLHCPGCCLD